MTQDEKVELYQKHLPLVRHLAGNFSARFPSVPYDALVEEGESHLGQYVADWDSHYNAGRSSPTTWIYKGLYWRMTTVCTRERRDCIPLSDVPADTLNKARRDRPNANGYVKRLLQNLGDEARVLVTTILEAPGELAEEVTLVAPARSREAVRAYMQRQGWTRRQLRAAWQEVRACLPL